jgi:hypothetical protein
MIIATISTSTTYFELQFPRHVLHIIEDKRYVLLEIHNALLSTLQASIMLILQPRRNPPEYSVHVTDKIRVGGFSFEVSILLLKWCMRFVLKGDCAAFYPRNKLTTFSWTSSNSIHTRS